MAAAPSQWLLVYTAVNTQKKLACTDLRVKNTWAETSLRYLLQVLAQITGPPGLDFLCCKMNGAGAWDQEANSMNFKHVNSDSLLPVQQPNQS